MLADKSIILTHRRWVIGQIRLDCHNSIYVLISPRSLFNKGSMGLPRVWDPKTVLLKRNRCDDFNLMEKWPKYSRPVEWDILALKLINNRLPNVNADFHIVGDSGIHKSKDIGRQTVSDSSNLSSIRCSAAIGSWIPGSIHDHYLNRNYQWRHQEWQYKKR